jgi:tripartite-type tricarboxylate transporter receptor subunit TctC
VIAKLNRAVNQALADPKLKARLAELGCAPLIGSPEDFGKVMKDVTDKWEKVVRFSGTVRLT